MIDTTPFRRKLLDLAITGKLVPKQGEWRTVKFADVCKSFNVGIVIKPTRYYIDDPSVGVRAFRNANIRPNEVDETGWVLVTQKALVENPRCIVHTDDVIIARSGAPGVAAVVPAQCDGYAAIDILIATLNPAKVDARYVSFCLNSPKIQTTLLSLNRGVALAHIGVRTVSEFLIPLPPLAEQKSIVKRLEELLKLEGEIAAESAALDDLITAAKRKVLDLAIRGKLVPQDPADEPASELLKRIAAKRETQVSTDRRSRSKGSSVIFRGADRSAYETRDGKTVCIDNEIPFDIPDSWAWARLGDIFQHNTGKALNRKSSEGEFREYITTSNVYWEEFKLDSLKSMRFTEDELDKCTIKEGDLLVCEGGDIGRAAIWNLKREVCIQNHLHRLRPFAEICRPYFCCVLHYYKYTNRIQGKGIGLQGLSSGMLHNLLIPIPPLEEQKRIVTKVEEIRNLIELITRT